MKIESFCKKVLSTYIYLEGIGLKVNGVKAYEVRFDNYPVPTKSNSVPSVIFLQAPEFSG